jgi:phenylpropionate dioxygenase-like ring-hydroxylating dioxygenase large terminal subunit
MATKAPFLKTPLSGYRHRDVPKEDDVLTHVGPDTACGEYLRRFWQPIAPSEDLIDLPLRVRILGEDLVLFRDGNGQVGLLELHCSHRGTSLEFGLIEKEGIRCCYHGWMFAVDGRILDTPGEPPDSTYKERLCHGAYPALERWGMVFAYMGPPDKKPPFPVYDSLELEGYGLRFGRRDILPCNWLQIMENAMDACHTAFLHTRSSGGQFISEDGTPTMAFSNVGELDWMETPIGMVYIHTRRVGEDVWVRMGEAIASNLQQAPGNPVFPQVYPAGETEIHFHPWFSKWIIPIDDTNTLNISINRYRKNDKVSSSAVNQTRGLKQVSMNQTRGLGGYGPKPTADAAMSRSYEDRQRNPGDYEAEVSQRPIAVHALEHLGYTDRGVTMLRKIVRDGIKSVQKGEDPKGIKGFNGEVINTFSCDNIMLLPPAATAEEDSKLLRQTGRRVAEARLKNPPNAVSDAR